MDVSTGLTPGHRDNLRLLREREDAAFRSRVPKSLAAGSNARQFMPAGVPMAWMAGYYRTPTLWVSHGEGPTFTDIDGNSYCDFNVCDMSAILGYANPRLTEAINAQATRGLQFFLPVESVISACEQLRLRFGLPKWQLTLAASQANAEALRIARVATGRQGVLMFAGKYHGMLDETLWSSSGEGLVPEELGIAATAPQDLAVVDFNDLDAAEQVLRQRRTAAVLIEGVLTNCGTVLPEPGFLSGLRQLCDTHGTLLVMDETHTQFDVYGGTVAHYNVTPDIVTGGKGIGGGIPIGAYGMTGELADLVESNIADETGSVEGIALGGTLYANAMSLACTAFVLTELMRPADYDRVVALGSRLADGIDSAVRDHGLDWRAHRFGARTGYCLGPELPKNAREAHLSLDPLFSDARRVFFANRGVWDAISSAGPHPGFAHQAEDVDSYLSILGDFLDQMCASGVS